MPVSEIPELGNFYIINQLGQQDNHQVGCRWRGVKKVLARSAEFYKMKECSETVVIVHPDTGKYAIYIGDLSEAVQQEIKSVCRGQDPQLVRIDEFIQEVSPSATDTGAVPQA